MSFHTPAHKSKSTPVVEIPPTYHMCLMELNKVNEQLTKTKRLVDLYYDYWIEALEERAVHLKMINHMLQEVGCSEDELEEQYIRLHQIVMGNVRPRTGSAEAQ